MSLAQQLHHANMPKKTNDLGQKRKKGSDKRRRTYELYGKCKPTRQGDSIALATVKMPKKHGKKSKK